MLVTDNGAVIVVVPPGAASEELLLTYSARAPTDVTALAGFELQALNRGGTRVTHFALPITIVVAFDPAAADPELRVCFQNADGSWTALPTTLDTTSYAATAKVDHFTFFALMVPPPVTATPVPTDTPLPVGSPTPVPQQNSPNKAATWTPLPNPGVLVPVGPVVAQPRPQPAAAPAPSPTGRFYAETGHTVSDDGGVRFLSEFDRLGGVDAVGYPASERFEWEGFTVQVFQRVIFQWRPEADQVYFVNTFDRLHDAGVDDWLTVHRQTPPPRAFADEGLTWDQIVQSHLAVLADYPALQSAYFSVVGDPVQANGLPTSDVTDMGNHYAVRAQRVVLQQWKEDVPWARAGQVTFALGGDIAKEAGILPPEPVSP